MITNSQIEQINIAVSLLHQGKPIAFPTDTVYGLGADPRCEAAIKSIFILKGRSFTQPLPILLHDTTQVDDWIDFSALRKSNLEALFWKLATCFWPGALTIVAKKNPTVSNLLTANTDAIAVRIPNHTLALSLLKAFGFAIIGTSANKSNMPSATSAQQVTEIFGKRLFVLDTDRYDKDGDSKNQTVNLTNNRGKFQAACYAGSTIVSLVDVPKIIRYGVIPKEQLQDYLD